MAEFYAGNCGAGPSPIVYWSDRIEVLADKMLDEWDAQRGDPFKRTCVLVGDLATASWLKEWFLLHRAHGRRRILANIDFKPIAEFVNDWLAAQVRGEDGGSRKASEHPYSRRVLAWRIYSIMEKLDATRDKDRVFAPIIAYVGRDASARRRFGLSTRLAQMYDDYLNYRFQMLARWEEPDSPLFGDEEPWQRELYRRLVSMDSNTYAKDYRKVFSSDANQGKAFASGFPRYSAIHVFDVAFAPWPYFEFIRRNSHETPVSIWSFSPCPGFWMDVEGKRERLRSQIRELRIALEKGTEPPEFVLPKNGEETDRALLGALAKGGCGALLSQVDISEGDCLWIGDGAGEPMPVEETAGSQPFAALRGVAAELHVCHSARRELEAVRNGIYSYLATHTGAGPGDVLVLCADWPAYAPLAESILTAEKDESLRIPVKLEGLVAEDTPLMHSFGELLAIREGRLEASAVFGLLGVSEIRSRFGIGAEDVGVLKELAREANIHWGFDDADVRETLGMGDGDHPEPFPYTWRRGLDRLELDALMGPRANPDSLLDAWGLGALRPCGHVEADRARDVACLDAFVTRLHSLKGSLAGVKSAESWRETLTALVDDFYLAEDEDSLAELAAMRNAIATTARDAALAWKANGGDPDSAGIEAEVFLAAVAGAVRGASPRRPAAGNAVRFAPLKNASATTADFVWICGLNDGSFPRDGARPSFDQIGRHPTPYDASLREWDTFALLKAALGARKTLAFSYVGRDIRSNEKIPPAVPLADILDWFRANRPEGLVRYDHPLQPYSARYFYETGGPHLPPNHSEADRKAAAILAGRADDLPEKSAGSNPLRAFTHAIEGDTVVELDDLIRFLSQPNTFLKRKLKVWTDNEAGDAIDDNEAAGGVRLNTSERANLKIHGETARIQGEVFVEKGRSESADSLKAAEDAILNGADRVKILRRTMKLEKPPQGYAGSDVKALDVLLKMEDEESECLACSICIDGRNVTVVGTVKLVESAGTDHYMVYSEYKNEFGQDEAGLLLHHLLGHAAGKTFLSVVMYRDGTLRALQPMEAAFAVEKLRQLLEIAFGPLPDGMPDIALDWKEDALPAEMRAEILKDVEFVNSARLPRA